MVKKILFYVFILSVFSACSQQGANEEDLITLEEVETAITKQGLELGEADLPSNNAFIQVLNDVSPTVYFIEGTTLSIYIFPSIDAREEGMNDFKEKTAEGELVDHERYTNKNILVFYEQGNEETNNKLNSAINGFK